MTSEKGTNILRQKTRCPTPVPAGSPSATLVCRIILLSVLTALSAGQALSSSGEAAAALWLLDQVYAPGDASQPRLVIKEEKVAVPNPVVEGEALTLSTVGAEHWRNGQLEFHPLMSVLVDDTFPESPEGEWLAVWTLGRKSPGFLSRLRATIPWFTARKRVRPKELRDLNQKLESFEDYWDRGKIKSPKPYLEASHRHRKSTVRLILASIKNALHFTNVAYPAHLLFRSYLLRRTDLEERKFKQAYLGLSWYADLAERRLDEEALSLNSIRQLKFQLLTERHVLGRWVDSRAAEDFVHGFEHDVRDHFWGTSCYLASAANEYHLAYEEFQRVGAGGVTMALGGILYYDPELAPEPGQVKWSLLNPFDLLYNPFEDKEVQKASVQAGRVPLAIYVYQSNLALKPIIAVDFFRPDNPRIRESATYWRKMGNEALGALSNVGLIYTLLNRALNFTANKKGWSWFSDKKQAFGLEELRLSLFSHLYFEPEAAEQLLDRVDRTVINPLVQPGRLQGLRAQLQYRALLEDSEKVLETGREIREKLIRERLDRKRGDLREQDYRDYRGFLRRREHAELLRLCMKDRYLPSVPLRTIAAALQALADDPPRFESGTFETLVDFRLELEDLPPAWRGEGGAFDLLAQTNRTLEKTYLAAGRSVGRLEADLAELRAGKEEKRLEAERNWRKDHAKQFEKAMKEQVRLLEGFVESGGDLTAFSPWYIEDALDFFRSVPLALAANPEAARKYRPEKARVEALLAEVERRLSDAEGPLQTTWLEEQRMFCLRRVRLVRIDLHAALGDGGKPAVKKTPASIADGGSSH